MKFKKFDKIRFYSWVGAIHRGFFLDYKKYKQKGMRKYGARCRVIIDRPDLRMGISIWTVPEVRLKKGWKK